MEKTYRAAIIGLGNIAWRFGSTGGGADIGLTHASAYKSDSRTTIVAGCSPEEADREAFRQAFGVPVFDSMETLIGATRPDIVSICSPGDRHYEQVVSCLDNEIPMIWLEKPPAHSLQALYRMIKRLENQGGGTRVLVNYQRRYTKSYQRLKQLYTDRKLGQCRLIQLDYSKGLEINGSHILDVLFYILGDETQFDVEWVSGFGDPENPSFAISFHSHPGAIVSGAALPFHNIDISMTFDHGRASIRHGGMTASIEKRTDHELFPGFYRLKENNTGDLSSDGFKNSMAAALDDLILSHAAGTQPLSSLKTAENTLRLVDRVRQAQGISIK